jgi:hypothetical protein
MFGPSFYPSFYPSSIDIDAVESSLQPLRKRQFVPKTHNGYNFGKKYRRGKRYIKDTEVERQIRVEKEQRKKLKANRDSWRRVDMPDEKDDRLDNLIYANFLGDKYGDNGAHYNNKLPVNLKFCDSMVEYGLEDDVEFQKAEEDNYRKIDDYLLAKELERQKKIEKEREEWLIEEQNFEEMYEYYAAMRRVEHLRERHICLVMNNRFTREEAELLVDYHESLNLGGLCDEALCPDGWCC